ncbi:hypothetical protein MKX08_004120 [Trichoderma sp. CBMAI-0020]|nr:hypothetical protein MKX08_004120 [Trichoderma sp. CBMAI-0020]
MVQLMVTLAYKELPLDTVSQQLNAVGSLITGGALIELVEVDGMLQSAVLDERAIGDLGVVLGQAHDEAEMDLGVGIELAGAEFDDVADALGGAVFAFDAAISGGPEPWMLEMAVIGLDGVLV